MKKWLMNKLYNVSWFFEGLADSLNDDLIKKLKAAMDEEVDIMLNPPCDCPNGSLCEFFDKEKESCKYGRI